MLEIAPLKNNSTPYFEEPQVLVFGSNIDSNLKAQIIQKQLVNISGVTDVSVDIEDWERVLRIECSTQTVSEVLQAKVQSLGFKCYELRE